MLPVLWIIENSPLPRGVTTVLLAVVLVAALPWLEPLLDVPDRLRARRKDRR